MRNFFESPQTLEELKKQYRELAFRHHPDKGGSNEAMKAVNAEYDTLFEVLKDVHRTKDGETYTAKQPTAETAEHFKDLIAELMKMDGITIEVIGCFVWVTGDTKPNKDRLKALGFKWSQNKTAWYLAPEDYRKKSRKDYDMEAIRRMYGTSGTMNSKGRVKIDEATA